MFEFVNKFPANLKESKFTGFVYTFIFVIWYERQETPFFGILSDNVSLMHQIRTQLLQGRLNDNVPMLLRFRENLFQLVASMSQVSLGPHPLRPMPIRLDVGLADSYLGKSLSAAGTQTMALAAAEISASAYTLQPGGGAPMPTFCEYCRNENGDLNLNFIFLVFLLSSFEVFVLQFRKSDAFFHCHVIFA